jgi:hypothetical protein
MTLCDSTLPFIHLKQFLAGQRLRFDEDTKHVLQDWMKGLAANFYEEGIRKMVPRYDKFLNLHGRLCTVVV